jgi:hypothetical protein
MTRGAAGRSSERDLRRAAGGSLSANWGRVNLPEGRSASGQGLRPLLGGNLCVQA